MPEYINDEYHIGKTFRKIEEELMSTVICNMKHNRVSDRAEKNKLGTMAGIAAETPGKI